MDMRTSQRKWQKEEVIKSRRKHEILFDYTKLSFNTVRGRIQFEILGCEQKLYVLSPRHIADCTLCFVDGKYSEPVRNPYSEQCRLSGIAALAINPIIPVIIFHPQR